MAFSETDDAAVISHGLINQTVRQGAAACVTRGGLALPIVEAFDCDGCHPWIICTRFPNGATSITTIGRTLPTGFIEAKANVTVELGLPVSSGAVLGIFGYYDTLRLAFTASSKLPNLSFQVVAQDLP